MRCATFRHSALGVRVRCACITVWRSVGREKRAMAEMCVKAVLAVADLERKDVNLDLIKVRVLL